MSATFLLVHGAWHGGWCWAATRRELVARGYETHAPTLTGLGERSHLAHAAITPDSHVEDILATIKWRELEDIVLVGHSYGGLIITGVAAAVPEKIRTLIYLDAFVPEESGTSVFANANPERMARFEAQTKGGGFLVDPDLFDAWTDDPALKEWLIAMCTPHPIGSIHVSFQGVSGHFPRSFRIFSPLFHILSTGGRHDGAATGASGDHPRPSRSRTFVRITILRITATSATLWALPAAVSRSYSSLIAGFQRMAVIAAM